MAFLDKKGLERLWDTIARKLSKKVDKVEGKSLSTNDYTTEEKEKLAAIPASETLVTTEQFESALGAYITDIDTLIGGES